MKRATMILAALALLVATDRAKCAVILVTTESGIPADGTINWGSLGGPFTNVSQPFSIAVTGISGLTANVSKTSGQFQRRNQNTGWNGNFGAGEQLLWTQGSSGPISLTFSSDVNGVGAQIQRNLFGIFTANIQAFNSANVLLGSFFLTGNSTFAGNDTAIFIGILSDSNDIRRVVFSVPGFQDFAINGPRVDVAPAQAVIPEPSTFVLLGMVLACGLGCWFYQRRRAVVQVV